MWYFLLLIIALIALNIFVIHLLFNNRIISYILSTIQIMLYVIIQKFVWEHIIEDFINSFTIDGLIIFLITIISYILIFYLLFKTIIIKRIIKKFINNYVPKIDIKEKELLGKFKYIYYHYNNAIIKDDKKKIKEYSDIKNPTLSINSSKIIHCDVFDVQKKDNYEDYLVVFYILGKRNKKRLLYINKVIFRKKIYKQLEECPNCGAEATKDSIYCEYCDTKLIDEDNIIKITNVKNIEELSLLDIFLKSNNNNICIPLLIINLLFIPYNILMSYIINNFNTKGFVLTLLYICFIVIPYILISIIEFKIFDIDKEIKRYSLLELITLLIVFFGIVMESMNIIKYVLIIAIAFKIILLLYDYILIKKQNKSIPS